MRRNALAAGLSLFVLSSATAGASAQDGDIDIQKQRITIQPMTTVDVAAHTGYFQDPYPIRTAPRNAKAGLPTFSGTTQQLLNCDGAIQPNCFTPTKVTIDPGPFTAKAAAAGVQINNFEGLNIFQDNTGSWEMAVTAHVKKIGGTGTGWNVIMHAHPLGTDAGVPTDWEADTLLVGDLATFAPNNYNGKYFQDDDGSLYLIYNKKVGEGQDAVVAQLMASPTAMTRRMPVPLLGPEMANGGHNSERAYGLDDPRNVRLIETGNVTKINGKYVMTYSVGTFNRPDYKAGIAYSDTFLPSSGHYYRRVAMPDVANIWGQPNHPEVVYLLQSQKPRWPNYVGKQVYAPGVPAIVSDGHEHYYLTFAGYDPSDAPTDDKGLYKGPHRRPYYVRLNVHVPQAGSADKASPMELAHWIEPAPGP
ncbi:hypothetical protein [Luteibacter yeojuensis]|uniref:Uncharacterized protein n=1 Tax=Luteibacter yeojuensis TaxID=345309 RepID=A0A0F3KRM0_9GAMM|nr:hypothetical protein [Luteibacter yeojuensis]KJV33816.1 hypothetical protein VI08_10675 [Luteibacter yeojuensis]